MLGGRGAWTGDASYRPELLATAMERPEVGENRRALQACKRLMQQSSREQIEQAMKVEGEEFASRVRPAEAREAFKAFLEKRPPDFTKTKDPVAAK
jgi:enoyl-CoA hydratase/carnithine racemase